MWWKEPFSCLSEEVGDIGYGCPRIKHSSSPLREMLKQPSAPCSVAQAPASLFPCPPPCLLRGRNLTLPLSYRVVDFLLKAIMRAMWFAGGFHRVAVKGRQALPAEAAILTLAPHSSYFDAIPVTMTMSSIVMKAESRDIPIWGSE